MKIGFFDIETERDFGAFILGGVASLDTDHVTIHATPESLLEHVFEAGYTRLYAHNASFDIRYLTGNQIGCGVEFDLFDGRFMSGRLQLDDKSIEIRDSQLLLLTSLAACSEALSLGYKKLPHDHTIEFDLTNEQDIEYLKTDCLALRDTLVGFSSLLETSLEKLPLTLASLAFKDLCKEGKLKPAAYTGEELRPFYHGGRLVLKDGIDTTEVYRDVASFDIKSAYPAAMRDEILPIPGKKPFQRPYIDKDMYRFLVNCTIHNQSLRYPVAIAEVHGVKAPYNGTFSACITDSEYRLLLDLGVEITVHIAYGWEKADCSAWAKPFVEKWYGIKREADKALAVNPDDAGAKARRFIAKIFLNSAYGKLAQRLDTSLSKTVTHTGIEIPQEDRKEYKKVAAVHAAAFITGAVRAKLIRFIYDHEGILDVLYGDTDSIKAQVLTDIKDVKTGNALGDFAFEHISEEWRVFAPKMYASRKEGETLWDFTRKGVPRLSTIHSAQWQGKTIPLAQLFNGEKVTREFGDMLSKAPFTFGLSVKPTKAATFIRTHDMQVRYATITTTAPESVTGYDYKDSVYRVRIA